MERLRDWLQKVGKGIKEGCGLLGHGLCRCAKATGSGIKRATCAMGRGIKTLFCAIGRGFKRPGGCKGRSVKGTTIAILALSGALLFCMGLILGLLISMRRSEVDIPVGPDSPQVVYYRNGVLHEGERSPSFREADVKELQYDKEKMTYISHSQGFRLDLPPDCEPDFTLAEQLVRFTSSMGDIVISHEVVPEGYEAESYMAEYVNRYLLEQSYLDANRITLYKNAKEQIRDLEVQVIALERTPAPGSEVKQNAYVYCYVFTEPMSFYRILFKAEKYDDALIKQVYETLYSFSQDVEVRGVPKTVTNYYPVLPENWSEETKALYEQIVSTDKIMWGAFITGGVREQNRAGVEEIEELIDYDLKVLLEYGCHFDPFPMEGMQTAYEQGKIVEFTMHVSSVMNENLHEFNPALEVLDGIHDETLRQFARDAKAFGKPFLFRLNNEMNSDWVSYGATATLNDPDVFIGLWRRIYRIFEEEGVNNAIWIFNPNNNSFPPQNYNHMLAYYPGNEYVHMYGITGYNTGTYYKVENNEKWFEFEELYDAIHWVSEPYFSKFPWIITEFASSSVGGDKPRWITDMFNTITKYENIKVAVWFNADDIDPRPEKRKRVARPYRLDENAQTAKAFREGIAAFK
ncbi:MAG: hypothetical protein E7414_06365 [Ruminococcaceae bacterium]|nr:hypothetical protein [Oscillospiraceae bacterium]